MSSLGLPDRPWVKLIVRRGRVKTQEWVPATILQEDKANDWVEVRAEGRTLQLKRAQVHIGPTAPTDSTKTMEDAAVLRHEVSRARGPQVSSPIFKGPLPYENAVGTGWLARDVQTTREELLMCTARKHNVVTLTAVSHFESYISLLEHDILHVGADIERRATVVKSLQRSCRDHRRSAELERKHDAMVQQSQGYNVNVAALKAEAIGFRSCIITKKASVHVNHTWKKYGSSGEYMRKADVEEADCALSFEDLLSEMKDEEKQAEEERAVEQAGGHHRENRNSLLQDGNDGGGGEYGDRHISDPFIAFGPELWWWLKPAQRTELLLKQSTQVPASNSHPSKTEEARAAEPSHPTSCGSSNDAETTGKQQEAARAKDKRAEGGGTANGKAKGMRKGFFTPAAAPKPKSKATAPEHTTKDTETSRKSVSSESGGKDRAPAKAAAAASAPVLPTKARSSITTPAEIFEEAVHNEMATLSNAKLAGCPCTLLPTEGYNCRCCSQRDAICKVMVLTGDLQTDHPFCYACLDKADAMLSEALGSALRYVPLDTINYGTGTRALPDRQPMTVEEAKIRFRAKTAKDLQDNPLLAAVAAAAANASPGTAATGSVRSDSGGGSSSAKAAPPSSENADAIGSSAAAILGGMITPDDQAKLDKLDRHTRSLVESPLSGDLVDWLNGAVAEKDKAEVRRVARSRMAQLRRDAVLAFESQAVREGWGKKGVRSSVKFQ